MVSVSFAASSILEQALEIFHSGKHNATRITEILVLTDLEHFTKKDQIKIIFTLETENTPAKGTRLVFQRAEPHLGCKFCGKIFPYPDEKSGSPYGASLACIRCGSQETQIMTFEVMVKKIKIGN
ncbi:MAG: hydrogenase nickel incorporation protein HypA [Candidatus Heimdallarchaeota archaeon LC_3]|nr:MAG: hydrogenase nickel incorporation protein HypA [Candidatus Heimdallarchaeota archaeon LC_3]